jgi:hypothetical protein
MNSCSITSLIKNMNIYTDYNELYRIINHLLLTEHEIKILNNLTALTDGIKSNLKFFVKYSILVDMYFSLAYIILTKKSNPILATKVIFNFNIIYCELEEIEKAGYVILKYFELDKVCNTFDNLINGFKTFELVANMGYLFSLINFKNLKSCKLKVNLVVSLLNIVISYPKCSEITYEWLNMNVNELKDLSKLHFTNICKLIYKLDESVIKTFVYNKDIWLEDVKKYFKLSNNTKILLYSILKDDLIYIFLSNHLTQIILLFRDVRTNITDYIVQVKLINLIELLKSKVIDVLKPDEKVIICGKLYNLYKNLGLNEALFYKNIILQSYKENKIVTVETILILLNNLKDYINDNKNCLEIAIQGISEYLEDIDNTMSEIKIYDNEDNRNFIAMIKFFIKIVDSLIHMIVCNGNISGFRLLYIKLNNIVSKLTATSQLKNLSEISYFHSFIKILSENDTLKQNSFHKFLSHKTEDTKLRLNIVVGVLVTQNDFNNVIILGLVITKLDKTLITDFLGSLYYYIEFKSNILSSHCQAIEFLLEVLNIVIKVEYKEMKLLQRLEGFIQKAFRNYIKSLKGNTSELNEFFNYFAIVSESVKKLNCEIYSDIIVLLELLYVYDIDNLFNLESNGQSVLKQILSDQAINLLQYLRETSSMQLKKHLVIIANNSKSTTENNYKLLNPFPAIYSFLDRLDSIVPLSYHLGTFKISNKLDYLILKEDMLLKLVAFEIYGHDKPPIISYLQQLQTFPILDGLFKDYITFELSAINNDQDRLVELYKKITITQFDHKVSKVIILDL